MGRIEKDGVDNLVEVNFIFNLNQEIVKDRHLMRVFSFSEIENLLSLSGFNVVHNYSNVKMEVFQESAGRMILICKRKQ